MISLEDFRARCREFLAEPIEQLEDAWATGIAFQRRLHRAGLAGITVPVVYGGQGLSVGHVEVLNDEATGRDLPTAVFTITIGMCVPVLLRHGTEEQKVRHIARMLRGDEIWCQLFSEPNAGSDVAAAQLKAKRDGDEWVLSGQKVWTSSAERAAFGMCIARTDVDEPKHRGLSMFIVPMDAAGITIRPLRQATGDTGFNEVFFDDVRIPGEAILGDSGNGWAVAVSMLMNERATLGAAGDSLLAGRTKAVLDTARCLGVHDDALAGLFIDEEVQRFLGLRVRSAMEAGRDPGPAGSIAKLTGSNLVRDAATAHLHVRGPAGIAWLPGDNAAEAASHAFVAAPGLSIAGGTSEIQRNIIGERVLGLPREPEIDKETPFRDIPQNAPPSGRAIP